MELLHHNNRNVGADDDVDDDDDDDRYDDDDDHDDDDLNALIMLLCHLLVLYMPYLLPFTTFLSAIIGFLSSTVVMKFCQPNGEIAYIYDLTI